MRKKGAWVALTVCGSARKLPVLESFFEQGCDYFFCFVPWSRVMEEETTAQRVFTISEVNALIPALSSLVGDQLREQSEIEQGLAELVRLTGEPPRSLKSAQGDTGEIQRLKDALRRRITRYETGWQRVQTWGGVVKDPQTGLVDFYGRVDGKLVWLCWRYGEDSLGYYHELTAGYSGRRPLSAEVRRKLVN
jgi:hypothetical protein